MMLSAMVTGPLFFSVITQTPKIFNKSKFGQSPRCNSPEVAEKTAEETANYPIDLAKMHLDQIKLILDKEEPEYKK